MSAEARAAATEVLVIEAGHTELHYWRDLWRYRELFYFLAWRDILVRYKQTAIGIAWAVIRPLLTMVVFTVVFGKLGKFPSEGVPYPILVYAAMLPWQFFASSLSDASGSLIGNANLISKVYFPRLIVPASAVITSFVDFLIAGVIMLALMAWYGFWPDWRIVALPLFMLLAFAAAMAYGAQREVPRFPLRGPVHRAVRALHLAGGLLEFGRAGEVAAPVLAQPDGGRDRRFQVGAAGR
jgi:lipopolysaccharide transport system permease protein